MEGYISFGQLGLFIIFLVLVGVGGYAIVLIRNMNAAVKDIEAILKENQQDLNQAISNVAAISNSMAEISGNMADISNYLRTGVDKAGKAVQSADQIASYAMVVGEAAKIIVKVLSSIKRRG